MSVLVIAEVAQKMLNGLPIINPFAEKKWKIRLHTGNPGPAGEENKAAETTEKEAAFAEITEGEAAAGRKNTSVAEWPEVKAKETIKFISFWGIAGSGGPFKGYAELTEPKALEVGNTFKFPLGSIVFHL